MREGLVWHGLVITSMQVDAQISMATLPTNPNSSGLEVLSELVIPDPLETTATFLQASH